MRTQTKILIFLTCISIAFNSCTYYYVKPLDKLVENDMKKFEEKKKIFIIHYQDEAKIIKNPTVVNETLVGELAPIDKRLSYLSTDSSKKSQRSKIRHTIKEIHIYSNEKFPEDNKLSLLLKNISKIEMYEHAKGKSFLVTSAIVVGSCALAAGIAIYLIILLKESCPFVYVYNGKTYEFTGEIFSGATHKNLERFDYLRLGKIQAENGLYKIKIANEIKEEQHINLAELMVIDHDANTEVLVDKYGNIQTIANIKAPSQAVNLKNKNILSAINNKDALSYISDSTDTKSITDGLILNFTKEKDAKNAKLVIRAKNAFWLDYTISKFHQQFGSFYDDFEEKQKDASREQMQKWINEQNIPLTVSIERNGKWEKLDYFNIIGPMLLKDDVLSISLNNITEDKVRIKLEYGNGFWEIDYVAMDFSENSKTTTHTVSAKSAINEKAEDVKDLITKDDSLYYNQLLIGNVAEITFDVPAMTNKNRTVYLKNKGNYRKIRDTKGIPNKENLESFKNPNRLNEFSNELRATLNKAKATK